MPHCPRDTNQLAKAVTAITTEQARNDSDDTPSGRAAGGCAHAAKLSAEQRLPIPKPIGVFEKLAMW